MSAEAVKTMEDIFDMSDEDMAKLDPATFADAPVADEKVDPADEGGEDDDAPAAVVEPTETADTKDDVDEDDETVLDAIKAKEVVVDAKPAEKIAAPAKYPVVAEVKPVVTAEPVAAEINYKAEYERLLAPFKANGKDIRIDSVDDALSLMQMGANYNKKMAGIKPNLKLLKMLENNGLLDENKLSYLIDLEKKNPAAIAKLVKDSGLDPLDMDVSKDSEYKPKPYTVDDREIDLDAVLDQIQETPTYTKTIDLVSNKWDGPSKQVIADNPQVLRVINDHMASGVYELISNEIERERMLGRLTGMSDIEAYRKVGDAIQARGGFSQLVKAPVAETQPKPVVIEPKPKVDDPRRNDKRRAASTTTANPVKTVAPDFNPLALSDEEFGKLILPKLI